MSDQGSETPPRDGPDDPQSHLRIIPPDPVPDAGDAALPSSPPAPAPPPGRGPRVRVFDDSEDPALLPLPAMGPGSGASRLDVDSDESLGSDESASPEPETSSSASDSEPPQDEPEIPEATEAIVEEAVEAEAEEDEATTAEHRPEVDEATTVEQPLAGSEDLAQPSEERAPDKSQGGEATAGALVGGVRLDRSDSGEIIKVSADQIPREAEDEPVMAAAVPAPAAVPEEGPAPTPAPVDRQAPRPSAMVKVATGLGFGAVALVVILLGRPAFAALAGLLVVWGAIEFYSALYQSSAQAEQAGAGAAVVELAQRPAAVVAVAAVGAMVATTYFYGIEAMGAMACAALVAALLWFVPETTAATAPRDATLSVLGIVHIGVAGTFSMLIIRLEHGFALLIGVVILVVVSDVAAYAWGSNLGHTPFFKSVSPNKSLEGFLGAVATTIAAALVITGLHGWLYPSVPVFASWGQMFVLAVLVTVAAAAGDLAESLFKRELGIKDVASFLPGHGGMLDRLDGMLFALPVAYVFFVAMGLADVG